MHAWILKSKLCLLILFYTSVNNKDTNFPIDANINGLVYFSSDLLYCCKPHLMTLDIDSNWLFSATVQWTIYERQWNAATHIYTCRIMTLFSLVMPPSSKKKNPKKTRHQKKKCLNVWSHLELPLSSQDAAQISRHLWLCSWAYAGVPLTQLSLFNQMPVSSPRGLKSSMNLQRSLSFFRFPTNSFKGADKNISVINLLALKRNPLTLCEI